MISKNDLINAIKTCDKENKMPFNDEQLGALTHILWKDAVDDKTVMSYQDLKGQLMKYPELVHGLAQR